MFRKALTKTATDSIPKILKTLNTMESSFPKTTNTLKNISKGAKAGVMIGTAFWGADQLSTKSPKIKLHKAAMFGGTFFAISAAAVSNPIIAATAAGSSLLILDIMDDQSIIKISQRTP